MSLDVFPRNNLNPDAAPWGREVESRLRSLTHSRLNLELQINGDNRAQAGQLGVVGRQVNQLGEQANELASRTISRVGAPYISAALSSGNTITSNEPVVLPGSGSRTRNAMVIFNADFQTTGTAAGNGFVSILQGSTILFRDTAGDATSNMSPAGWLNSVNGAFALSIPSNGIELTLRLQTVAFSGSGTAMLPDGTFDIYYGDAI